MIRGILPLFVLFVATIKQLRKISVFEQTAGLIVIRLSIGTEVILEGNITKSNQSYLDVCGVLLKVKRPTSGHLDTEPSRGILT
jgi:hypothetical protein